jgi:hypothetical protein
MGMTDKQLALLLIAIRKTIKKCKTLEEANKELDEMISQYIIIETE